MTPTGFYVLIQSDGQHLRQMQQSRLKTEAGARTVITGHAFVQNLRRSHYELTADIPPRLRVQAAFAELALAV